MDHSVLVVLRCVLARARPQVAVLVPISLEVAVHRGGECVASDIELSVLIKEGLLNVFLDDIGAFLPVNLGLVNDRLDVVNVSADLDANATVGVLSRFDNPHGVAVSGVLD